jgi:aspartyl-tRNA(Asn)/glutamyl-tRNA(Gln) amidotransferase subunit A
MNDLHWLGALELARAIAARRVSPVEVVEAQLARIGKLDGQLKSYLAVFAEPALAAARAAEARVTARTALGPLDGVPVAVKDLYDVQGSPTTGGSRFLTTPAAADSAVVARLRTAGAIVLGKLNMHEFAYGPEGTNPHHGTPWNPWDPATARYPGGSSSGSGVAVAAGLAPVGMGSDTGGSIRMPAALCGTVGLKPTYGRVSRAGVLPLSWSLDHTGPLTRRVADAAAILTATAGHDPADSSSSARPVPDYVSLLTGPVRGIRIGLLREYVGQADPPVQSAVLAAARVLEGLGCALGDVPLPSARYAAGATLAIIAPEASAYHAPLLRQHAAEYAPDVRQRLLAGRFLTAEDYVRGQQARRLIRDEVDAVLRTVDCLLMPTLPVTAPPLTATELRVAGRREMPRNLFTMFTRLFNLTGHPALAVPCGFSDGLPVSLQLVGRAFDEATILRLGHAYEEATEWHTRRPPS